jgi:hypothetical protein
MAKLLQELPKRIAEETDYNEVYLRIWEQQQECVRTRWNHVTFFLGISFAIFGLSLQNNNPLLAVIIRVCALSVYWFSYLLYNRSTEWSEFLVQYLEEFENKYSFQYPIQRQWKVYEKKHQIRWLGTRRLLLIFGVIYLATSIILISVGL